MSYDHTPVSGIIQVVNICLLLSDEIHASEEDNLTRANAEFRSFRRFQQNLGICIIFWDKRVAHAPYTQPHFFF